VTKLAGDELCRELNLTAEHEAYVNARDAYLSAAFVSSEWWNWLSPQRVGRHTNHYYLLRLVSTDNPATDGDITCLTPTGDPPTESAAPRATLRCTTRSKPDGVTIVVDKAEDDMLRAYVEDKKNNKLGPHQLGWWLTDAAKSGGNDGSKGNIENDENDERSDDQNTNRLGGKGKAVKGGPGRGKGSRGSRGRGEKGGGNGHQNEVTEDFEPQPQKQQKRERTKFGKC
jgi:hypothetical protein